MRYFLPDSQDLVDPSFDFETEQRSRTRIRQRDDLYAHEIFKTPAYDGLLVSKSIVDGFGNSSGRYTLGQRQRLLRGGARAFFRIDTPEHRRLKVMGDCGAFSYVKEPVPPYSVDEVVEFYADCGFDYGISVDHVILGYDCGLDAGRAAPKEFRERQQLTLQLARDFRTRTAKQKAPFVPIGVVQGWSPASYAKAAADLQKMGYDYIALGGLVPLKTHEILEVMEAVAAVRNKATKIHMLGVTRTDAIPTFADRGAVSFDSTSPLRQAFKDNKDNFYTMDRTYVAIRIPQTDANPALSRAISSGRISQSKARDLEGKALDAMRRYDKRVLSLSSTLRAVMEYERLFDERATHEDAYRETLADRPWASCPCAVCRDLGHHVILFRGAERNRRRGFHNTWTFYQRLGRRLAPSAKRYQAITEAALVI